MTEQTQTLDVKGLMCPLPVLKARKVLGSMRSGAVLRLISTDPASIIDVPHFCGESGHELIGHTEHGGVFTFEIKRK